MGNEKEPVLQTFLTLLLKCSAITDLGTQRDPKTCNCFEEVAALAAGGLTFLADHCGWGAGKSLVFKTEMTTEG